MQQDTVHSTQANCIPRNDTHCTSKGIANKMRTRSTDTERMIYCMFMNYMTNQCVQASHRVIVVQCHAEVMKSCNRLYGVFTSDLPDPIVSDSSFLLQPFPLIHWISSFPSSLGDLVFFQHIGHYLHSNYN